MCVRASVQCVCPVRLSSVYVQCLECLVSSALGSMCVRVRVLLFLFLLRMSVE